MPKGKSNKPRRARYKASSSVTDKQRTKLLIEARKARKRITSFSLRSDSNNYVIPRIEDYKLESLLNRIAAGENYNSVLKEVKNIQVKNITSGIPSDLTSAFGYTLNRSDIKRLRNQVVRANEVIRQAKEVNPEFSDIYPSEFNVNELLTKIVNPTTYSNLIERLNYYVPENMQIMAVPETGEAITVAEYKHYVDILEAENKRRERNYNTALAFEQGKKKGFIRVQNRFDEEQLDIASMSRKDLKRRAATWDDPARVYRANLFLTNYSASFEDFVANFRKTVGSNDVIEARFAYIRELIARFYNNEEAIDYISTRMPMINIAIISGVLTGDVDFDAVYNDWTEVDLLFPKE